MKQLLFITTVLILCAGFVSAESETERTITVLGEASVEVQMDRVSWSLNVIVKENNQEKLREKADRIIADVKDACERLGFKEEDIYFSKVTIHMRYKNRQSKKFSHYELTQYISLTQKDVDRYNEFWKEFTSIDGIHVDQSFFSSQLDETRKQLRLEAVQQAREKATEFSDIVEMKIGKTISISEFRPNSFQPLNSSSYPRNIRHKNSPRTIEVSAKIYVVFELL